MRREVKIAVSAALIVWAAPLAAQLNGPPTARTPVGSKPPEARNGQFGREFDLNLLPGAGEEGGAYARASTVAKCIVQLNRSRAPKLLGGALAGDPDYSELGRGLRSRYASCLSGAAAPAMMINGALAEQLALSDDEPLEDRATNVNVDEATAFYGDLSGQVTIESLAGCLAVYSPGLALKVLKAEVGSTEETAALSQLYSSSPECGVSDAPSGIAPAYQRGALAAALYQWKHRTG